MRVCIYMYLFERAHRMLNSLYKLFGHKCVACECTHPSCNKSTQCCFNLYSYNACACFPNSLAWKLFSSSLCQLCSFTHGWRLHKFWFERGFCGWWTLNWWNARLWSHDLLIPAQVGHVSFMKYRRQAERCRWPIGSLKGGVMCNVWYLRVCFLQEDEL